MRMLYLALSRLLACFFWLPGKTLKVPFNLRIEHPSSPFHSGRLWCYRWLRVARLILRLPTGLRVIVMRQ